MMTRRQLVKAMGAITVMPALGAVESLQCIILDEHGAKVTPEALARFHTCDLLMRALPIDPTFAPGKVSFEPPDKLFRISVPLRIPEFGNVFVYADNEGVGYTRASLANRGELLLNYEFAAGRLATVRRLADTCESLGIVIPAATQRRITAAAELLQKANAVQSDQAACARTAMKSLSESLWAGESLVFERAKYRIGQQPPRPDFLFGCSCERYVRAPESYREYFNELFNYATVSLFDRGTVESRRGVVDYSKAQAVLNALQKTTILVKGHALIFLEPNPTVTPAWLQNLPFPETQALCASYVGATVNRFRSRVTVWDIINEAHFQPPTASGMAGFTRDENVELTLSALKAARQANSTCFRVVNNTGTWCDYYMGRTPNYCPESPFDIPKRIWCDDYTGQKPGRWQQNVYDYLTMLKEAGAQYEAVGLQYYYSGRDTLEFERNLETFQNFGRPIHITEAGIPSSSSEVTPKSDWWGGGTNGARFVWHGDQWTESAQADWFEQFYTIAYSKPWVEAITTWDLADPAYVPHGGLLDENGKTKESYHRLSALLAAWRRRTT